MYTVISKGQWLNVIINDKTYKIHILTVLPKNKCIVKNSCFDIVLYNKNSKFFEIIKEEIDAKPMIESLPLSLLRNGNDKKIRKFDAYTPWEHRTQPISIEGEGIDLLPWDKEEIVKNEMTTQTFPDIALFSPKLKSKNPKKQRKILTLAFPQINVPDRRPLTTLEIDIKYKSVSNSPVGRKASNRHKNSVY
jgi:hypothetical protein